jgi:exosome complex component RRP4
MAITILAPTPANVPNLPYYTENSSDDDSDGGVDLEGDIDMRPKKRARHDEYSSIVTPGETVTDDPQWMRHVLYHPIKIFQ